MFSTHFEALSGCIRGQEFAVVRSKKSFNNLKDSGKHAFSVIGGGLKPQWLNMGGGLGEGGEIRKTGPADLIPGGAQIGPKSTKKVNILMCLLHCSLKNYDFLMCLCDFTLLFSKGALC